MIKISKLFLIFYNFAFNKIFRINRKHVFLKVLSSGEMMKAYLSAKKYADENKFLINSAEYDFYMNLFLLMFSVTKLDGKKLFLSIDEAERTLSVGEVSRMILLYSFLDEKRADKMLIKRAEFGEDFSGWDYNESFGSVNAYE